MNERSYKHVGRKHIWKNIVQCIDILTLLTKIINLCTFSEKSNSEVCTENKQCSHMLHCTQNMCSCPSSQYWNRTACTQSKK